MTSFLCIILFQSQRNTACSISLHHVTQFDPLQYTKIVAKSLACVAGGIIMRGVLSWQQSQQ